MVCDVRSQGDLMCLALLKASKTCVFRILACIPVISDALEVGVNCLAMLNFFLFQHSKCGAITYS